MQLHFPNVSRPTIRIFYILYLQKLREKELLKLEEIDVIILGFLEDSISIEPYCNIRFGPFVVFAKHINNPMIQNILDIQFA